MIVTVCGPRLCLPERAKLCNQHHRRCRGSVAWAAASGFCVPKLEDVMLCKAALEFLLGHKFQRSKASQHADSAIQ